MVIAPRGSFISRRDEETPMAFIPRGSTAMRPSRRGARMSSTSRRMQRPM